METPHTMFSVRVAERFSEYERDGFAVLKSLPNYMANRFPEVFATFSPEEKRVFREGVAYGAPLSIGLVRPVSAKPQTTEQTKELVLRFLDYSKMPDLPRKAPLARDLRIAIEGVMKERFSTVSRRTEEPGEWVLEGRFQGELFEVTLRFSMRAAPLLYTLRKLTCPPTQDVSFETLYGCGSYFWDLVALYEPAEVAARLAATVEILLRDLNFIAFGRPVR